MFEPGGDAQGQPRREEFVDVDARLGVSGRSRHAYRDRGGRRPRMLGILLGLAGVGSGVGAGYVTQSTLFSQPANSTVTQLYVNPLGSDHSDGRSSMTSLRTIQAALDLAQPGTQINVAEGVYRESLRTVRAGSAQAAIVIRGPETGKVRSGRYRAVVYGTGTVLLLGHSHYVVEGLTFDGQPRMTETALPGTLGEVAAFKDSVQGLVERTRLIAIGGASGGAGVTGVVVRNMFLHGAGGECVRLRNGAKRNVVEDSVIEWCGFHRQVSADIYPYHNGEGVYIGTSPKSGGARDASFGNAVRRNLIYTYGAECFDVKESSHDNTFEGNDCRYNDEPLAFGGSNIELRGHRNTVLNNKIVGSRGWNVKFRSDGVAFDKGGNSLLRNVLGGSDGPAAYVSQRTVGQICGNKLEPGSSAAVVGRPRLNLAVMCPKAAGGK